MLPSGWRLTLSSTGRFSICRDDGVHRLHARRDRRYVGNLYRHAGLGVFHDNLAELVRIVYLGVHQSEVQLMVLLKQARRIDEVRTLYRVENVGDRDARSQQLRGFRRDVELGLLAALHQNSSNAIEAIEARLQLVSCHCPKLRLRNGV